jgi:osmotically-inducible protein OsmY
MTAPDPVDAEPALPLPTPRLGLQKLAEGLLQRNPYPALKNVTCEFQNGVLVLRGRLPTYYLKQRAQEAVSGVGGVERVVNEIEVAAPALGASEAGQLS